MSSMDECVTASYGAKVYIYAKSTRYNWIVEYRSVDIFNVLVEC